MKHLFTILSTLLLSLSVMAQDFDRMRFADTELQGTARYVGMSGAMAALGGDVSAVKDNPAALGVFRRSELSISIDGTIHGNLTNNNIYTRNRISMPQIAGVLRFGNPNKQKGIIFHNIILQYNRLNSYYQNTSVSGNTPSSQTHWMATPANQQGISPADITAEGAFNNENLSWLTLCGAEGGLIQYDADQRQWLSITNVPVNASLHVREGGSLDEYSAGWGFNVSNTFYWGFTTNMRTLSYEKVTDYKEQINDGAADYHLQTTFVATGLGLNAATGVIYRPTHWLRLGASFQTPTFMTVSMRNYASMTTHTANVPVADVGTPENSTSTYGFDYLLPMRAVAGLAFQLNNIGLISLEYDYTHQADKNIPDVHCVRIGTEWVVKNNLFLRVGCAHKNSFLKEDIMLRWSYNDVRTDTDFRSPHFTSYVSAGIGYRNKRWIIDAAYQYRLTSMNQYFIEDGTPFALQDQTHRIVVTLGWTRR